MSLKDSEILAEQEQAKEKYSVDILRKFSARFELAESHDDLKKIAAEITPALKKTMIARHVAELKEKWVEADNRLKGGVPKAEPTYENVEEAAP